MRLTIVSSIAALSEGRSAEEVEALPACRARPSSDTEACLEYTQAGRNQTVMTFRMHTTLRTRAHLFRDDPVGGARFRLGDAGRLQRGCPERDSILHQRRWRYCLEESVRLSLQQLLHDFEQLVFVKLSGRSRRRHPMGARGWRSWKEEMGRRSPFLGGLSYFRGCRGELGHSVIEGGSIVPSALRRCEKGDITQSLKVGSGRWIHVKLANIPL